MAIQEDELYLPPPAPRRTWKKEDPSPIKKINHIVFIVENIIFWIKIFLSKKNERARPAKMK